MAIAWIKDDFHLWKTGALGPFPQGACVHVKLYGQHMNPRTGVVENLYFAGEPDQLGNFDCPMLFESDFETMTT